jgi:hypothetical protein
VEDAAAPHVQAAYRYLSRSGRGRSSHCEPAKHEVPTHLPSPGFIGREDAEGLARSAGPRTRTLRRPRAW